MRVLNCCLLLGSQHLPRSACLEIYGDKVENPETARWGLGSMNTGTRKMLYCLCVFIFYNYWLLFLVLLFWALAGISLLAVEELIVHGAAKILPVLIELFSSNHDTWLISIIYISIYITLASSQAQLRMHLLIKATCVRKETRCKEGRGRIRKEGKNIAF